MPTPESNDMTKGKGLLIAVCLVSTIGIFALFIWGENSRRDQLAQLSVILLPLLASWIGTVLAFYFGRKNFEAAEAAVTKKVTQLQEEAKKEPEKVRFIWELTQVKFESYVDRNLRQIQWIFWISVIVMITGFGLILSALFIRSPYGDQVKLVAAGSGIVTEFIGATFMLIYRSTITQAQSFVASLEKFNMVGMAMQVIDTIPDDAKEIKNDVKAEIARRLLGAKITN